MTKLNNRPNISENEYSLIYTLTNAATILKIKTSEIFDIVVLEGGSALVTLADWSMKIITKSQLLLVFGEKRKARSRQVIATKRVDSKATFTARTESKATGYKVELNSDRIDCECIDYSNQIEVIGIGACKHIYAVLGKLGFTSLKDYLISHKPVTPQITDVGWDYPKYPEAVGYEG